VRIARKARRKNIPASLRSSGLRSLRSLRKIAQKNFFFFEKEQKTLCQKNQKLTTKGSPEQRREMKNLPERSISGLSDGLLFRLYNVLYSFFKIQNEPMHRP